MNSKMFRKVAVAAAVASLFLSSLACDDFGTDGNTVKEVTVVIENANTSCNDITSCVGDTPQELANLCQLAGGYHDTTGACVMP